MPENNHAPERPGSIGAGDVSGTVIAGSNNTVNNVAFIAESGGTITVHEATRPSPVKRPSISQLPRSTTEPLIGRARDVRTLQEAIGTRPLVQIWGASGVGKSALLRHLACTVERGRDGAAHIEAGGRTADDIAQAIFDIAFDAPNYKPSWEVMKEHLKTLRLRIYLDDAGLDDKELRRLVDMAEHSTFVFTSQQQSTADGVHAVRLQGLTTAAAAELVAALLSRELGPDEVPLVHALCDAVDGNPLRLRRIALSAATGTGLPGIADLPELLPALLNKVRPEERDLLHLLGSLSGAELAPRHLNELLGRTDSEALADGLVRHGLLLASETGYSCPPDVAECVLSTRRTEFPADRLCRTLTTWVEAQDTTPDDVAVHFQALDVAVRQAERSGHAPLGVALARAASPKLALSRQFDAWGSLLGAGWSAARSAGDEDGEGYFLQQAETRGRAIGRATQMTVLALEAGVLGHELAALYAHSAAGHVANAASASAPLSTATHGAVHAPALAHPAAATSATTSAAPASGHASAAAAPGHAAASAPGHAAATTAQARPVVDMSSYSSASAQPHAAAHAAATPPTTPVPRQIDLSSAHSTAGHATPAASATTPATSAGNAALATGGAAAVKGGASAFAVACAIGFAAVLGVGAMVYANEDQSNPSPAAAPSAFGTPSAVGTPDLSDNSVPADATSPSVDPVCATVIPDLSSKLQQYSTDADTASGSVDAYNSAMDSYNSGATSTPPDDSTLRSEIGTVISDLQSVETTLQDAISQAVDSSVESDLDDMLTATQQLESMYQSYANDPENSQVDPSSQASAMNAASDSLQTDCGA